MPADNATPKDKTRSTGRRSAGAKASAKAGSAGSAAAKLSATPGLNEHSAFADRYDRGEPQVVSVRLVADLETPVSAYLKVQALTRASASPLSFLLESVEGGAVRGRYSIIGLAPDLIWRAHGNLAEVNRTPSKGEKGFRPASSGTLEALRDLLEESRIDLPETLPPMAAGVFGYMGYDTVRLIERLPNMPPDQLGVPDALLIRPTLMIIFDAVKDEMTIVTPVRPAPNVSAEKALRAAHKRIDGLIAALEAPLPRSPDAAAFDQAERAALELAEPQASTSPADYMASVEKARSYIRAGDIFQVVLSQRFQIPFPLPPFALYRALRRTNPSPFLFHLDLGAFALVGSSPEILVRARGGEVTIRPIAGTARRGANAAEDQQLAEALLNDPKERAEHLMLLDLGRNDVGRVAEIGSVTVTDRFTIERYSHVMHIVSNVVGRLAANHDAIDALMAGFPAGTVSGAPKVRAMEIIDELEPVKRGPYAGCVGYFSASGDMDTCIVLRTGLVKDGTLYVQAGAGVVFDSVAESEQQECINKAKALYRAAAEAVRFAGGTSAPVGGNAGPWA